MLVSSIPEDMIGSVIPGNREMVGFSIYGVNRWETAVK